MKMPTPKRTSKNTFDLSNGFIIQVLINRINGRPYLRFSHKKNTFFISKSAFEAVYEDRSIVETSWCTPQEYLPKSLLFTEGVEIEIRENDEGERVLIWRKWVQKTGGSFYKSLEMPYKIWQNLQNSMDPLKVLADGMERDSKDGEQVPLRLNFKTLLHVEEQPPGVVFTRETPDETTWQYKLPIGAFQQMESLLPILPKLLENFEERLYPLHEGHHILTKKYGGKMLVGFAQLNEEGQRIRGCGMNIDSAGFQVLLRNYAGLLESIYLAMSKTEIWDENGDEMWMASYKIADEEENEEMEEMEVADGSQTPKNQGIKRSVSFPEEPKKLKPARVKQPQSTQYQWYIIDKAGAVHRESDQWHYSEAACRNDAEFSVGRDDELLICVKCRLVDTPSITSVIEDVICVGLIHHIRKEMSAKCPGCEIDAPDQKSHMQDGCLSEWKDAVTLYMPEDIGEIACSPISHAYCRLVLEFLQLPLIGVESRIGNILEYTTRESWEQKVIQEAAMDSALRKMLHLFNISH